MGSSKLLAALEKVINKHSKETDVCEFDQLLAKLEGCGRITTKQRQSLRLCLALQKLRDEIGREENTVVTTDVTA